jgi:diacylglycerol kinase
MKEQKFSIMNRIRSFIPAFNGLKILIKEEHNSRIHLLAAILVLIASILFRISAIEWIVVIFAIGLVFVSEIINSAIENITDFISSEKNDIIKKIKDLSAAGVLISSFTSLIIGLIVFIPKVSKLF